MMKPDWTDEKRKERCLKAPSAEDSLHHHSSLKVSAPLSHVLSVLLGSVILPIKENRVRRDTGVIL